MSNISKNTRKAVANRDAYSCVICGANGTELHHYRHRSQGGSNGAANIVTLCRQCHEDVHEHDELLELDQRIVEYLADYYAYLGFVWIYGEIYSSDYFDDIDDVFADLQ